MKNSEESSVNLYWQIFVIVTVIICANFYSETAIAAPPSYSLVGLQPLPKVHYSWPIRDHNLDDELLFEYVRITHAWSIRGDIHRTGGEGELRRTLMRAKRVLDKVNARTPDIEATLAINYSVWHEIFPKDAPPTLGGDDEAQEIALLTQNLEAIRTELAKINTTSSSKRSPLKVSAILFDSERFAARKGKRFNVWNEAIARKHTAAYEIARKNFPKAHVDWYSRGCFRYNPKAKTWHRIAHLTLLEPGDNFTCSLYEGIRLAEEKEMLRRTTATFSEHGIRSLTAWIALGAGYKNRSDDANGDRTGNARQWSFSWDYPTAFSWRTGRLVNIDTDWNRATESSTSNAISKANPIRIAAFYPEPFGRVPDWSAHFVAYVRGATGMPP